MNTFQEIYFVSLKEWMQNYINDLRYDLDNKIEKGFSDKGGGVESDKELFQPTLNEFKLIIDTLDKFIETYNDISSIEELKQKIQLLSRYSLVSNKEKDNKTDKNQFEAVIRNFSKEFFKGLNDYLKMGSESIETNLSKIGLNTELKDVSQDDVDYLFNSILMKLVKNDFLNHQLDEKISDLLKEDLEMCNNSEISWKNKLDTIQELNNKINEFISGKIENNFLEYIQKGYLNIVFNTSKLQSVSDLMKIIDKNLNKMKIH